MLNELGLLVLDLIIIDLFYCELLIVLVIGMLVLVGPRAEAAARLVVLTLVHLAVGEAV